MNDVSVQIEEFTQLLPKGFQKIYFGNSVATWILACAILIAVALAARALKGVLVSRMRRLAERTTTELDDAWLKVVESTAWFFYVSLGAFAARSILEIRDELQEVLSIGLWVLMAVQVGLWGQNLIGGLIDLWARKQHSSQSGTVAAGLRFVSKLVIWTGLVLVVLSSLGVELTTVVAGLGVGGVAAALAVQKILGDLFAGLSMYFDRPFDIGDFIIVGDVLGNVTKIGLRTTRIDSLGGEKVVYPNGELASKYVRNYQRMRERRVVFEFGIEYGHAARKVQLARDVAQEVIESLDNVRFDRAHFKSYGAYSLDFEVVYYVLSKDYNEYMDRQHQINMAIYERFEKEGITFAFPTRTVVLRGSSGVELPTRRDQDKSPQDDEDRHRNGSPATGQKSDRGHFEQE